MRSKNITESAYCGHSQQVKISLELFAQVGPWRLVAEPFNRLASQRGRGNGHSSEFICQVVNKNIVRQRHWPREAVEAARRSYEQLGGWQQVDNILCEAGEERVLRTRSARLSITATATSVARVHVIQISSVRVVKKPDLEAITALYL